MTHRIIHLQRRAEREKPGGFFGNLFGGNKKQKDQQPTLKADDATWWQYTNDYWQQRDTKFNAVAQSLNPFALQ